MFFYSILFLALLLYIALVYCFLFQVKVGCRVFLNIYNYLSDRLIATLLLLLKYIAIYYLHRRKLVIDRLIVTLLLLLNT